MIPGSNLLSEALSIISSENVSYYQFTGRTLNAIGQDVATYNDPITISGSFQPVPKTLYEEYGLDLTRTYAVFYVSQELIDVNRNTAGDQIIFNGNTYQCEGNNDWFAIDGWVGVLVVLLTN